PLKVNVVVRRGCNEEQILPLARHFRGSGVVLRFIEYMDAGCAHGWRMEQVVPSAEVLALLQSEFALAPLAAAAAGETAQRYAWLGADGQPDARLGEIGVISSVTQPFCRACCRARLSMDGKLFMCLFAAQGYELREMLRSGTSDAQLDAAIAAIWRSRDARYSELRASLPPEVRCAPRVAMSYIGG
ncbi:MAG: GTP 3',8-cyclase MoaA, partial [Ottowia sp.]|nr:GTP 3',8-cyclase MoaA [Ottowia sp.]